MSEREAISQHLRDVSKGLQKLFYFMLLLSLLALYLLGGGWVTGMMGREAAVKSTIQDEIETLQPILGINQELLTRKEIVDSYRRFIDSFYNIIEDAAAIAFTVDDTGFLNLNPRDADMVIDDQNSLVEISMGLDFYDNDDYSALPVANLITFSELFIHPSPINTDVVAKRIEAAARILEAFEREVTVPGPVPPSFAFEYYVRHIYGDTLLANRIDQAPEMNDILSAVTAVEQFASENDIPGPNVSAQYVSAYLQKGELSLEKIGQIDKINLPYFPPGIERVILLLLTPMVLAFISNLFSAQYRRRRNLIDQLESLNLNKMQLQMADHSWLLSNLELQLETSSNLNRLVLLTLFLIGLALPFFCLLAIIPFIWNSLSTFLTTKWIALFLAAVSLLFSGIALGYVFAVELRVLFRRTDRQEDDA